MEQVGLFGNADKESKTSIDYDAFVKKFEVKKTTDDCYTPPDVYQAVVDYVDEFIISLADKNLSRPFYPGGDYQREAEQYDETTVVIDNPPFSILAQIINFYCERRVKFFLFAPHLTLFSNKPSEFALVVVGTKITYANGAIVNASFVTNLTDPDVLIKSGAPLAAKLKALGNKKNELPRYDYPANVVTASRLDHIVDANIDFEISRKSALHIRCLDSQRPYKKSLFGAGFLVSNDVAERLNAERKKIVWGLSEGELTLITELEGKLNEHHRKNS